MSKSIEAAIAEKKAEGWSWVAAEFQRVRDEIRAAREEAEN